MNRIANIKKTLQIVLISSIFPISAYCQCANFGTAPNQDYDCDGITNQNDLDDDNDGILDVNECSGTSTFDLNTTTLTGSPNSIISFPASFTNVNGVHGLDINITPSGNFTTSSNTSPSIIGNFNFTIDPSAGNGVSSTWTIDFVGISKPKNLIFNTPNNIYGQSTGAYEQLSVAINRLGIGNYAAVANTSCTATSSPSPLVIVNNPSYSQANPTPGGYALDCGYSSTFNDNNGIASLVTTYGMPVVTAALSNQVQPFSINITVCNDDIDGDGIPSYFDLDSDGDGCPDASEGGGSFPSTDLQTSVGMAGGSTNVKLFLGLGPVDANGVPVAVGPGGQTVGSSQDSTILDEVDCRTNPLAINDLSLSSKINGGYVTLNWQTITESNTSYFKVEESFDAKEYKATNNIISASGESTIPKNYTANLSLLAKTYYRIALHYNNGDVKYSNIVTASPFKSENIITVSPNPTTSTFNINIKQEGSYTISISDATGKNVDQINTQATSSNTIIPIQSQAWTKGLYIVTVINNATKERTVNKIVKQ